MGFLKILTSLHTQLAETHLVDRERQRAFACSSILGGGISKIMRKYLNTSNIQKRQAKV